MSEFPDSLPPGWSGYDSPPGANEPFGTEPTWLFANEAHQIGVMLRPVDPDVPHSDSGFQVALTRGTPDDAETVETLRRFDERDEALKYAREAMETCDRLFDDDELEAERAAAELG